MIERKEFIDGLVRALYAACEGLDRGDVLAHATIENILGVPPHVGHWDQCIKRLMRTLREGDEALGLPGRHIVVRGVHGVGYRLLTKREQLDCGQYRTRRARRQILRGARELAALPDDELRLHDRRMKALSLGFLAESKRTLARQMDEARAIGRVRESLPRPPLPEAG